MTLPPPECKVYTPPQLADAMVGAIEPRSSDSWLDPCIGPGAFITPLRKRGISKDRIIGIDIDPEAGQEDGAATTLRGIDFFEWCSTTKQRFTKIVANPPYVAIRKLPPDQMDAATGLRVSELLALRWEDVNFKTLELSVTRSIWHQVVGSCKTEASAKPVPLDRYMAEDLLEWRRTSPYPMPHDWVFASPT